MQPQQWIITGALVGALGVGIGAFGAHGLEGRLKALGYDEVQVARRTALLETAVRYQMFHVPALILAGLVGLHTEKKTYRLAAWFFLAGIAIFSGLLYVLVFAGDQWKWLGAVVPVGGTSLIVGWVTLAVAAKGVMPKK